MSPEPSSERNMNMTEVLSASQCPISAEPFPEDPGTQDQLKKRCRGLHGVKMGVPWDCQQFVVCCNGMPLLYACHAPWDNNTYEYMVSACMEKNGGHISWIMDSLHSHT